MKIVPSIYPYKIIESQKTCVLVLFTIPTHTRFYGVEISLTSLNPNPTFGIGGFWPKSWKSVELLARLKLMQSAQALILPETVSLRKLKSPKSIFHVFQSSFSPIFCILKMDATVSKLQALILVKTVITNNYNYYYSCMLLTLNSKIMPKSIDLRLYTIYPCIHHSFYQKLQPTVGLNTHTLNFHDPLLIIFCIKTAPRYYVTTIYVDSLTAKNS